jgi:hypothetical protein
MLSDSPPIRPIARNGALSTLDKKSGTRVKIISLLTSVSRLTMPRKKTLGFRLKILACFE